MEHSEAAAQRFSIKKRVLKSFVKFTGKHLSQSLFFNKVAGITLELYINKEALA